MGSETYLRELQPGQVFQRTVVERLQSMTKNETFQERVAQMTQDPKFMAAATKYAEEMKDDVAVEAADAGADAGVGMEEEDSIEDEEEDILD